MELKISNVAKKDKKTRTALSQQQLVNSLLTEKQAVAPQPAVQNAVKPVTEWSR